MANLLPTNKTSLPVAATEVYKAYIDLFAGYSNSKFASTLPDSILKLVNVDVVIAFRLIKYFKIKFLV